MQYEDVRPVAHAQVIPIRDLGSAISALRWHILAFATLCCVLSVVVSINLEKVYRAQATILVEDQSGQGLDFESLISVTADKSFLYTQRAIITSTSVMELAAQKAGFFSKHGSTQANADHGVFSRLLESVGVVSPEAIDASERDSVINEFSSAITITPVIATRIIKIESDMTDKELALQSVAAVIDAYIERQLESRMNVSGAASQWMENKLSSLKQRMREAEGNLQAYLEREAIIDLSGGRSVSEQELEDALSKLSQAEETVASLEAQYSQIQKLKSAHWSKLATVPGIYSDSMVKQFRAEYAKAESLFDRIKLRYGHKHPKYRAAEGELASAESNLHGAIVQMVSKIEREYELSLSKSKALQEELGASKKQIQQVTEKQSKLSELRTEVAAKRQLYNSFVKRINEIDAMGDNSAVRVQVIDEPRLLPGYVWPHVGLFGVLSFLVGLIVAIVIVTWRSFINQTFSSAEKLERALSLPVAAALPRFSLTDGDGNSDPRFLESVRSLRTFVTLNAQKAGGSVIQISSSEAGEGKSSTSLALAQALSTNGKVLLLEADLRRPVMIDRLKLDPESKGLSDFLSDKCNLQECIVRHEDVLIIPAGTSRAGSHEKLGSRKFAALIEKLASSFDWVVVDTPPVNIVSDALEVSRYSDQLLYLVRAERTEQRQIIRGVSQFEKSMRPVTALVVNAVRRGRVAYEDYYAEI